MVNKRSVVPGMFLLLVVLAGTCFIVPATALRIDEGIGSGVTSVTQWPVDGGPDGIAVGPGGEVFVNINNNYRVVKYSPQGEQLAEWSVDGVIETNGIAVGPGGEVFVNINNNYRVVKYSSEGDKLAEWTVDGVIETNGIAVGPGGEVFVNINNSHRVVKYSSDGEKLTEWTVDGEMSGIAVGPDGRVYIADSGNNCVQVFQT